MMRSRRRRTPIPLLLALCVTLAATTANAQLGVRVTAITDLEVRAQAGGPFQIDTLLAGTDLSAGFALSAMDSITQPSPVSGSASSIGTTQRNGDEFVFELIESAGASAAPIFGPQGSGSFGLHSIELVFDHPTARAMELVIERCRGPNQTGASSSGEVRLPDGRIYRATPQSSAILCIFSPFAEIDVVPITIDRSGYRVEIETSGGAVGSRFGLSNSVRSSWRITVRPDSSRPCAASPYGQGCGPSLQVQDDPSLGPFAFRATLHDPALPTAAWLIAGGRRTQVPVTPLCDLLNDALVLVPWPVDPQGRAEVALAPRTGQMFSLQLQAATWANGLRLSNGFEFTCR